MYFLSDFSVSIVIKVQGRVYLRIVLLVWRDLSCLSHTVMPSDQLCLGRIKSFGPYHINVSLLYGLKGKVEISDINLPYREALDKLINEQNVHWFLFSFIF